MTSQKDLPDLYEASIAQLQAGLARGDFTSVQLTQAYLSRIQEVNSKLRCVVTTNPHALEAAAKADELRSSYKNISAKPLLGIPIAVKDNIATCAADGMATTASSLALKGAMAKEDSDVVSALKEAGAIILGKLSLSEWAYRRQRGHQLPSGWGGIQGQMTGAYGDQANPSGSSGGPAVATSVGLCAASLGTETFGSCVKGVRIWISVDLTNRTGSCLLLTVTMWLVCDLRSDWLAAKELCVLFSSPSILFMTDTGQIPISSNHDSVGPMTRCVEDAAIVLEALTNSRDYLKALNEDALKGKRLGLPKQFKIDWKYDVGSAECIQVLYDQAEKVLKSLGAEIVRVDMPEWDTLYDQEKPNRVMAEDLKAELPIYLQGLQTNPNNIQTVQDVIDFNLAHRETEMPTGYEAQNGFETAAASLDRDSDPDYHSIFREYSTHAKQVLSEAMKTHKLDAFVFPGVANAPFCKAQWPQVIVPMGFLGELDTPIIKDFNRKTKQPFPIETWEIYPGMPMGLTFGAEAFSEAKLLSFAYAFEQATHHRLRRKALPQYTPSTQL